MELVIRNLELAINAKLGTNNDEFDNRKLGYTN